MPSYLPSYVFLTAVLCISILPKTFPACAGVILARVRYTDNLDSVPRMCGDDPCAVCEAGNKQTRGRLPCGAWIETLLTVKFKKLWV